MKTLVAYYSESGNTEKLAYALAAGLGTVPVRLETVDPSSLPRYDLICLGTPVQNGGPSRAMRDFIARMPTLQGKPCAAFCTMHAFGDKRTLQALKALLEAKGMSYLGGCSALGWSRLVANFGPRIFNRGRPNHEELARAEELGQKLLARLARPKMPPLRPTRPQPSPAPPAP